MITGKGVELNGSQNLKKAQFVKKKKFNIWYKPEILVMMRKETTTYSC